VTEISHKPADLRRAAMDYLARREHSAEELLVKLKKRFGRDTVTLQAIVATVEDLAHEGLQCDGRFASGLVRQSLTKGLGPRRVNQILHEKGLSLRWEQAVDPAEADIDWFDVAEQVYNKRFGKDEMPSQHADRRKEQARRARFMQYRGFDPDHFMHLLEDSSP
jgi:regulatory protein